MNAIATKSIQQRLREQIDQYGQEVQELRISGGEETNFELIFTLLDKMNELELQLMESEKKGGDYKLSNQHR
jgi:uncharacterized protein involved in exopolysaccharide biosynthesis